ncbi:MAG: helix-hairpin-helix domain-containing protein [Planctomycetota bacterium]
MTRSDRHWTETPARLVIAAVLGGVGVIGVGHSMFSEGRLDPLAASASPRQAAVVERPEPIPATPARTGSAAPAERPASEQAASEQNASEQRAAEPAAEQIAETRPPEPASSRTVQPTDRPAGIAVRIDVNSAPSGELQMLPRIGPVLAARIIEDRAAEGPFRSLGDLQRVRGIGPRTAERLAPLIAFGDADPADRYADRAGGR